MEKAVKKEKETVQEIREIKVADIEVGKRLRPVGSEKVGLLSWSIALQGLLQPLVVATNGKGYRLVTGAHRLEAVKSLGWETVQAVVLPDGDRLLIELAEIDENLMRADLHFIEKGEFYLRRIEILRRLEENSGMTRPKINTGFVEEIKKEADEKLGVGRRVFFQELQLARNLISPAKDLCISQDMTKKNCTRIANLPPDLQEKLINGFAETAGTDTDFDRTLSEVEFEAVLQSSPVPKDDLALLGIDVPEDLSGDLEKLTTRQVQPFHQEDVPGDDREEESSEGEEEAMLIWEFQKIKKNVPIEEETILGLEKMGKEKQKTVFKHLGTDAALIPPGYWRTIFESADTPDFEDACKEISAKLSCDTRLMTEGENFIALIERVRAIKNIEPEAIEKFFWNCMVEIWRNVADLFSDTQYNLHTATGKPIYSRLAVERMFTKIMPLLLVESDLPDVIKVNRTKLLKGMWTEWKYSREARKEGFDPEVEEVGTDADAEGEGEELAATGS